MATVRDVMSPAIVTVEPGTSVAEAATVMGTNHVGSALVMDGDGLIGIFTERDVMRAVASDFDGAHHTVSEFMTREPATVEPGVGVREALDTMLEHGFRHLPVMYGDRVAGVVSMRDLTASLERERG
jgi:CBS domain-containing protein